MQTNQIKITSYDYSNAHLNQMAGWDIVWIVNGPLGRLPIVADTPEEAKTLYLAKEVSKSA